MIISIAIPSTGAEVLAIYLDYVHRRRILYDYDIVENDRENILYHIDFLQELKVIHGPFHYTKYKGIFDEAVFITSIRHPVDWAIARCIEIHKESNLPIPQDPQAIVDFIARSDIPNGQSALVGTSLEDVDFVVLYENIESSIQMMSQFLRIPLVNPFEDAGCKTELLDWHAYIPEIPQEVRVRIFNLMQEDNAMYAQAAKRFNEQKMKSTYVAPYA